MSASRNARTHRDQDGRADVGAALPPGPHVGDRLGAALRVRADRYLIRPTPAIGGATSEHAEPDLAPSRRSVPCTVEAVVVVDGQGRIPLCPVSSLDRPAPPLSIAMRGAFAVLRTDGRGVPVSIDRRLRMLLPKPTLRRIGLSTGDRVAIVRLDATTLALTRVDHLAVLSA